MRTTVYITDHCKSCADLIGIIESGKGGYGLLNLEIINIEENPNREISIVPALCFEGELVAYGMEDIVKKLNELSMK